MLNSLKVSNFLVKKIVEPTLYVKKEGDETQLILSLYVDDLLVTGENNAIPTNFKGKMESMFEMLYLGEMSYFLGMEVSQTQQGIFLSQKAFVLKILNKFSMQNYKATNTPVAVREKLSSQCDFEKVCETSYRSLVGCLLYLTAIRLDIMYDVSLLSRFMHYCNVNHFQAAKRVLRYIKGTQSFRIMFTKVKSIKLLGFSDSDWAGSIDDMKSTSGSKKQTVVAQSTTEAEYVAAGGAVNQAIWLMKIMADLNSHQKEATEIKCDNQSVVAIAKNPVFHVKTKHFKINFCFVREMEQSQEVKLIHCSFEDQLADILTKPLCVSRFKDLRAKLRVCIMQAKEEC
ncbi:laccase-2-like [Gossypium australe]|uniref:Laccase-2-like n=1 Tax=Gossypium australe TaxID=47621 RepID=A0A5B6WC19_9ROSI|nr:laccase-2-like [Gossypium australe]